MTVNSVSLTRSEAKRVKLLGMTSIILSDRLALPSLVKERVTLTPYESLVPSLTSMRFSCLETWLSWARATAWSTSSPSRPRPWYKASSASSS